ncbi:hypothetical protein AFR_41455 [Actinoplanes friuliensis DSM 7358]|uniref:DUF3180 domain-containing protein n=2 Tax=Actinoplanes friuliensis TaxID=196914 RepID=U5WEW6_9ACTN|nr:hypothetical protein AFR_41455 [Actinoplanes friuliensis DSM 7358]
MSSNPGGGAPDPSMRPTSLSMLVVAGLAAAAVGWLLLSAFYTQMPRLPWLPIIVLATLAIAEAVLAQNTSARIQRKPGAPRVDPLAVARFVVLAKASSLAGALFGGFSAGLLAWLALEPTRAARDDVPAAVGGVAAALALVGAALWLERSCRVPEQPDQKGGGESGRQAGRS